MILLLHFEERQSLRRQRYPLDAKLTGSALIILLVGWNILRARVGCIVSVCAGKFNVEASSLEVERMV